jgi:hypothetical protein
MHGSCSFLLALEVVLIMTVRKKLCAQFVYVTPTKPKLGKGSKLTVQEACLSYGKIILYNTGESPVSTHDSCE